MVDPAVGSSGHKSKMVFNPLLKKEIGADAPMIPLLIQLWRFKINTIFCCQDLNNSDKAQIVFKSPKDTAKLLKILNDFDCNSLNKREMEMRWFVVNGLIAINNPKVPAYLEIWHAFDTFNFALRFPTEDIKLFTKTLSKIPA